MAILALVLGTTYSVTARALSQEVRAANEADLTIMAAAVLDEYVITYPAMGRAGVYKDRWTWSVSEVPHRPKLNTDFDDNFAFFEVTATVSATNAPNVTKSITTIVARRGPGA